MHSVTKVPKDEIAMSYAIAQKVNTAQRNQCSDRQSRSDELSVGGVSEENCKARVVRRLAGASMGREDWCERFPIALCEGCSPDKLGGKWFGRGVKLEEEHGKLERYFKVSADGS